LEAPAPLKRRLHLARVEGKSRAKENVKTATAQPKCHPPNLVIQSASIVVIGVYTQRSFAMKKSKDSSLGNRRTRL